jgi:hypothetical protein
MLHIYYLSSHSPRARFVAAELAINTSVEIVQRRILFDCWGLNLYGHPARRYDIHPNGQSFIGSGLIYGGMPISFSETPQDIRNGININDNRSLAWFERWLKEDKDRVFSPELDRILEGETVTQINVILNWFEELKRKVPTGN